MAKSSAYYAALYALCECTKLRNKKFCITFVFVGHRTVMLWRRAFPGPIAKTSEWPDVGINSGPNLSKFSEK